MPEVMQSTLESKFWEH